MDAVSIIRFLSAVYNKVFWCRNIIRYLVPYIIRYLVPYIIRYLVPYI